MNKRLISVTLEIEEMVVIKKKKSEKYSQVLNTTIPAVEITKCGATEFKIFCVKLEQERISYIIATTGEIFLYGQHLFIIERRNNRNYLERLLLGSD